MKQVNWPGLRILLVASCLLLAKSAFAAEIPGSVTFNTRVGSVVDAKVSRPDGSGAGAGVQAQIFLVGPGGSLTGITPATTFRTDSDAARYYVEPVTLSLSSSAPGQQVTLRMRAWAGALFENSTLRGESADFSVTVGGGLLPPANLVGLSSFSLMGAAAELVTITASAGANGSISPSGTMTKSKGATIIFSAAAKSGFVVEKWTVNGMSVQNGGTSFTLANVQENRSVNVSFKASTPATIAITAAAGPNGSINPAGVITKPKGESQSFTATPASGYVVEKWSVNSSAVQTGGATFTLANVQENRSVFVTFRKQEISFTITAINGANGSISPSGTILKAAGESQLFVATPNSRYIVDKWFVDGREVQSSGNTYTIEKIQANHDVSLSFRSSSPGGAGFVLFNTHVASVVDAKVSRPDGTLLVPGLKLNSRSSQRKAGLSRCCHAPPSEPRATKQRTT